MSLSFEDSLKNNVVATSLESEEVAVASADIAIPSIMTLDESYGIAAYSGDDGS